MRDLLPIVITLSLVCLTSLAQNGEAAKNDLGPYGAVATRFQTPPVIDGDLSDECWGIPSPTGPFVNIRTLDPAEERTVVRLGFDDRFLYVAVDVDDDQIIAAPNEKDRKKTWKDDSVEIFLSAERNPARERHFIVGAAGALWDDCQALGGKNWDAEWTAVAKPRSGGYAFEVKIPLEALIDVNEFDVKRGCEWSMKLTRTDKDEKRKILSSWTPIEGSTADKLNVGRLLFEDANLLSNADFTDLDENNHPRDWHCQHLSLTPEGDDGEVDFEVVDDPDDPGGNMLKIKMSLKEQRVKFQIGTKGGYSIPRQPVNTTYRFSADVRWESDDELTDRSRPTLYFSGDHGESVGLSPDETWERVAIDHLIPKGEQNLKLILQGARITGTLSIKNMRLEPVPDANYLDRNRMGFANATGAIPLKPGEPVTVEKVGVEDCRVLTVFIHNPVDGRIDTRGHSNNTMEYPFQSGEYGRFDCTDAPALHVKLADDKGFDATQLRGDAVGKLYRKRKAVDQPDEDDGPIANVSGQSYVFRKTFANRVETDMVSFFPSAPKKQIGDISFFRFEHRPPPESSELTLRYHADGEMETIPTPIERRLRKRFKGKNQIVKADPVVASPSHLGADEFLQIITPPQDPAYGATGMTFDLTISRLKEQGILTIRIHDPLNPRREIMGTDFLVNQPGAYRITMDFPDQVFLPPPECRPVKPTYNGPITPEPRWWITLASGVDLGLKHADVAIHRVPRAEALDEALAQRKFLLKGYFIAMSGPRPWTIMRPDTDVVKFMKTFKNGEYEPGLGQLFETLEQCRAMAPDDDVVRQYHDWIFKRKLGLSAEDVVVEETASAPRWATLAREALKATTAVPRWWADHRLLPSGEMGGAVQDDSDIYQTWMLFPLLEDKPLGEKLRAGAANLNNLADKVKLENGLNKRKTDVLHAYEEGINHTALSAFWHYGDPVFLERVMRSAKSIMKLPVVAKDGNAYFEGEQLGVEDLGNDEKHAVEGENDYHSLLLHPVYEVVWYNRNPAAMEFLKKYVDTRIARQKDGKWVSRYNVDGAGGTGGETKMPGQYYQGEAWLAMYQLTGDPVYLAPFKDAFERGKLHFRQNWRRWPRISACPELRPLIKEKFGDVHRVMSGYNGFQLTGDKSMLEDDLKKTIATLSRFPHMNTAAEPQTDRVIMGDHPPVNLCFLGTHADRNAWAHDPAVSYEGFGTDFAALVYPTNRDHLKVAAFNFKNEPLKGKIRVWRLPNGVYEVKTGPDANDDGELDSISESKEMELRKHAAIEVELPPGQLTLIEAIPIKKLDDLHQRADLALSPFDTTLTADGKATVNVHNIGSKRAEAITVSLVRDGEEVETTTIPALDAPLDLNPKIETVIFKNARNGDEIIIDRENTIPEIAEHNNVLCLKQAATKQKRRTSNTEH